MLDAVPLLLVPVAALFAWRRHRQAAAAQAEAASARDLAEARGRALGLVALDLRGPGLALLSQADAVGAAHGPAIAAEARLILTLADDIAESLAAQAGPRRLCAEAVPVAPLIEEAVGIIAAQLGAGRREWRLAPEFAGLTLSGDPRALRGALLPVLARAARMTREGDCIELRPVVTAESVAIVVEDEGAGIGADDLAAGAAGTRGLGFGLSLTRTLLEAHGGALRMEALRGVGARVWLTLPRERLVAAEAVE
ncbi:MAG TPA: ATP-binding protein [Crenalkalicoccus sp.]|jgi:signal transduction histidine kinase|nr:ATP-binding protein [Crenalkalicoccus sp.]